MNLAEIHGPWVWHTPLPQRPLPGTNRQMRVQKTLQPCHPEREVQSHTRTPVTPRVAVTHPSVHSHQPLSAPTPLICSLLVSRLLFRGDRFVQM